MKAKINALNRDLTEGRIDMDHYAILARQVLGAVQDLNRRVKYANMLFVSV